MGAFLFVAQTLVRSVLHDKLGAHSVSFLLLYAEACCVNVGEPSYVVTLLLNMERDEAFQEFHVAWLVLAAHMSLRGVVEANDWRYLSTAVRPAGVTSWPEFLSPSPVHRALAEKRLSAGVRAHLLSPLLSLVMFAVSRLSQLCSLSGFRLRLCLVCKVCVSMIITACSVSS